MSARYIVRPDSRGFSVSDLTTGEPVVIAQMPQTGLSKEDAEHMAGLLNARETEGQDLAQQTAG